MIHPCCWSRKTRSSEYHKLEIIDWKEKVGSFTRWREILQTIGESKQNLNVLVEKWPKEIFQYKLPSTISIETNERPSL